MRNWNSLLLFMMLISMPCFAQHATVSVNADSGLFHDARPFGKYLEEICTLTGEVRNLQCTRIEPKNPKNPPAEKATAQPIDQTITLKLACDPSATGPCNPKYPLIVGDDFFVTSTSDSGQTVWQKVLLGSATPVGGSGTVQYRANNPGFIIIRAGTRTTATAEKQPRFAEAAPVDLILQVIADRTKADLACPVLPPPTPAQSMLLDASTIVSLLGNPTPFLLAAQGPNTIAIYSTRHPILDPEKTILDSFQEAIAALAGRTVASLGITPVPAKPFTVELTIPHASALGDLATRINGLNYTQFTVQDVGSDKIRVTAPTQPDCDTWKGFLTDIRSMTWQLISEPMSKKLFYLSSSDVAAAFSGLASAAATSAPASTATMSTSTTSTPTASTSATPATTASSAPASPASTPPAATTSTPATTSATSAPTTSTTSASITSTAPTATTSATPATTASTTPATTNSNAVITISQPPGSNIQIASDTTPCVLAGLAFGNANACGSPVAATATSASSAAPATATAASTPKASLSMASVAVAMGASEQTPPDLLVFSDTNSGDDAQIQERLRVIAQLDLPRPEVIINAWVTQNSSTNPQAMGAFGNMVKDLVAEYDRQFENVVLKGWESLKKQVKKDPEFFNEPFRSYVADRFIADTFQESKPGSTVQDLSQAFLDRSQAKLADPITSRTQLGICERGRYCLGYSDLFKPVKPTLTTLLLTIFAAQNPSYVAEKAIANVEGEAPRVPVETIWSADSKKFRSQTKFSCSAKRDPDLCRICTKLEDPNFRSRFRTIWDYLDLDKPSPALTTSACETSTTPAIPTPTTPPHPVTCAEQDYRGILESILNDNKSEPRVHLQCFKSEVERLLKLPDATDTPPYGAGLMRAALADFLFNYKMSQQYPHEFSAYGLSQSADALNNALSPLIDAFNRDLTTYQLFVRADMQYRVERLNSRTDGRCCVKRLFGLDKPSFFNDGLITVRTLSGQLTNVNTTSQSFLNASTAPELAALLNSSNTSTATNLLSHAPAVTSALSNYQTTFAQIGRTLNISATPRSLNTASSAEIAVTLNADESASPTYFTGSGSNSSAAIDTSRVASHDTTTRVRVDSVKLFEVSSFTAVIQRSHSRFPLLPPFIEIPYIGTFAGIPLGSAKEFHSSTAILSAYVTPTATDLGYGLNFVPDLVVDGLNPGLCSFSKEVAGPNVTNVCLFRKALSLKDLEKQPISDFNKEINRCFAMNTSREGCQGKSFDGVPRMHQ